MPLPGDKAMRKLPKEKRDKLIIVIVVTAVTLSSLWFGLIDYQNSRLATLAVKRKNLEKKLSDMENSIRNGSSLDSQLAVEGQKLADLEENMASGDLYSWMVNTLRQFKLSYKIDIPQFSTIATADMNMLPKFPYKQATMTINGTAYFHELGRFVADFENRFPQIRIQNLDIQPASGLTQGDREKLTFKMDIVALIKSGAS
jgi:Tfp pilus assembly protein PilO